ncbi:MAG: hypothetical protein GC162_20140 [Planctomycetes bacterium]|nr:hypothetical protein [Planctomycetota bacterium]
MTTAPIITLLTDFGLSDVYVGIMKGVILTRCPAATIIDLTHDLPQGNIPQAGYLLAAAWRYYPAGTVHCAVVDPGVGTDRRIIAAEVDDQFFIAPDNGLLSNVFDEGEVKRVVSVENETLMLEPISQTFHGRDIFAPCAASIAAGLRLEALGPATDEWIHLPRIEPGLGPHGRRTGQVIHIDRFGNIITNLRAADVPRRPRLHIARHSIRGLQSSYAAVPHGELLAIIGSTGRIEISIHHGDAAAMLGVSVGDEVTIEREAD